MIESNMKQASLFVKIPNISKILERFFIVFSKKLFIFALFRNFIVFYLISNNLQKIMNLPAEIPKYKNIFFYFASMLLSFKDTNYKDDDIFLQRENIGNIFIKKRFIFKDK